MSETIHDILEAKEPKTGFIAPVITEDHHVLGSVGIQLPVINPDGTWENYLPVFESQLETTFDSDGCTVYGTLNAIEVMNKFLYKTETNYSDRFTYNVVGILPPGSDPHLVATTIRGTGLVTETDLPSVVASFAEFITPRPVITALRILGQKWNNKQILGHQWLWTTPPDQATRLALIKEGLTKGTVCVSVTAWYKNEKGLYFSPMGQSNGHWTMIYKIDDTGIYVFDSYNDAMTNTNLKKLTLDHNIQFAKVYFFTTPTTQQNWLIALITSLLETVGVLEKKVKPIGQCVITPTTPKYDWKDKLAVRHSVRMMCDDAGLPLVHSVLVDGKYYMPKDIICAVIQGESGFNIRAINHNKNGSTDYGIVQMNNQYWIGPGKLFKDAQEVYDNPAKSVQFIIDSYKTGKMNRWYAYKDGVYKKYL